MEHVQHIQSGIDKQKHTPEYHHILCSSTALEVIYAFMLSTFSTRGRTTGKRHATRIEGCNPRQLFCLLTNIALFPGFEEERNCSQRQR